MLQSEVLLLFVLYGAPGIAALLFLVLGFAMARTRFEVGFVGALAGALVAVHAAELYFLWGLQQAFGADGDALVLAGTLIAALAATLTIVFFLKKRRT